MGALRFFDLDQIVVIGVSQREIQVGRDLTDRKAASQRPFALSFLRAERIGSKIIISTATRRIGCHDPTR